MAFWFYLAESYLCEITAVIKDFQINSPCRVSIGLASVDMDGKNMAVPQLIPASEHVQL